MPLSVIISNQNKKIKMDNTMKRKSLNGLLTLVLATLLLSSCSKVPQAEIDSTNAAIELSMNEGADIYLKDQFLALKDSMKSINESIEASKSKIFKNYSDEVKKLEALTIQAQEVQQQTINRKEEIKNEISVLVEETRNLISLNQKLILEAPRGKEGTTALQAIKGELAGIESVINDVEMLSEKGELINSLDKIKAAREQADMIYAELTEVINKYKSNLRTR
jgi:hypothetical protein